MQHTRRLLALSGLGFVGFILLGLSAIGTVEGQLRQPLRPRPSQMVAEPVLTMRQSMVGTRSLIV